MRSLLLTLLIILGCGEPSSPHNTPETVSKISDQDAVIVVDRLNRSVNFAAVPQRVVSLSPATTELLFAIGAGPQVVAATNYCNYPPEALRLPRVGAGMLESISRETILGLQPDLILCKADTHAPLIKTFEQFDIPIVAVGSESLPNLFDEILLLGRIMGHEVQARNLMDSITHRLEKLAAAVATIPAEQRRSVFYEVWDEPLMTVGPHSFIGELLILGGMKNIFDDTKIGFPKVNPEIVVSRNPDVILAPSTHDEQSRLETLLRRQGWADIKAIRERQVFLINGDHVSRCGPRLVDALEEMIRKVYPDRLAP